MLTVEFDRIALFPGARVLDAGCGGGRHACEAYRTPGVDVVAIDLCADGLPGARDYLSLMDEMTSGRWLVARADVTRLPFADGAFDVVVCSEVLEHIEDDRAALRELLRVLKKGGDLVVTVPRYGPERLCWSFSRAYRSEPGGHLRIYRKAELIALLAEAGADCRRIRYRHALHSPYWWLRCAVGHRNEQCWLVRAFRKFLEWEILRRPPPLATLETLLCPLIGKSLVLYAKKG